MTKVYTAQEIAEMLLQVINSTTVSYFAVGIDDVEYNGQGSYTVRLDRDSLESAAGVTHSNLTDY